MAEQLAVFALVIRDAMLLDHCNEIPLCVTTQRGLTEMRVRRQVVFRLDVQVRKIAPATAGHENLLAKPIAAIDIHNNPGLNPHYAAINRVRPEFLRLASYFSSKVVYFTMPVGTLSLAFSRAPPLLNIAVQVYVVD